MAFEEETNHESNPWRVSQFHSQKDPDAAP